MSELFGRDLHLLTDLERQSSRVPGEDLATTRRTSSGRTDLDTLLGEENLRQALLLRFMTPTGELEHLGHPDYGSRLSNLVGELNNERTRNLAKLYTLQALAAEPRVERVVALDVVANPTDRTKLDITVSLLAITLPTPLNLVFGFSLESGVTP